MQSSSLVRGVTLIELLVGVFLSGLLLTLLVKMFTIGFRVGQEEMERSKAETAAVIALKKIKTDLSQSTPAGISLDTSGHKLVTQPLDTVTVRRRLVYEDRLWYWSYDPASDVLTRSEFQSLPSGSFDTTAKRLTPAELSGLSLAGSSRVSNQIPKISHFEITNPSDVTSPSIGSPITVTIEAMTERATTRKTVRFVKSIWLPSGAV